MGGFLMRSTPLQPRLSLTEKSHARGSLSGRGHIRCRLARYRRHEGISCGHRGHRMRLQSSTPQPNHVRFHCAHEGVSGLTGGEASCGAGCGAGVAAAICLRFLSGRLCTVRHPGFAGCEGPSSIGGGGGSSCIGPGPSSCYPTFKPNMNFCRNKNLETSYLGCPIWGEFASCTVFRLDTHQFSDLTGERGSRISARAWP